MAGVCSGSPWPCSMHGSGTCELCGCYWDWGWEECTASPTACSVHGSYGNCIGCGCDWTEYLNIKVNIADVFKEGLEAKLNVADSWRVVREIWQNVADVWRRVF